LSQVRYIPTCCSLSFVRSSGPSNLCNSKNRSIRGSSQNVCFSKSRQGEQAHICHSSLSNGARYRLLGAVPKIAIFICIRPFNKPRATELERPKQPSGARQGVKVTSSVKQPPERMQLPKSRTGSPRRDARNKSRPLHHSTPDAHLNDASERSPRLG